LELIRRENYTKEQLDVPGYFQEFQNKNPREIAHRVKAYQFKRGCHSSAVWRKQTATVSKAKLSENKKVLVDTDFVHLHNHTFSVLQSTISIPQLVKAASKEKCLQLP
jgi:DNA polymerase-3 subunit alpha